MPVIFVVDKFILFYSKLKDLFQFLYILTAISLNNRLSIYKTEISLKIYENIFPTYKCYSINTIILHKNYLQTKSDYSITLVFIYTHKRII